jgi:ABC-type polysaccharide/polyol phosphate transport system ATPase subunit
MHLRARQITKTYRRLSGSFRDLSWLRPPSPAAKALDSVDWDLIPGSVHGIIGPNGSGKTTLLNILTRITSPTSGWVEREGRVASVIGTEGALHAELRVGEAIALQASLNLVPQKNISELRKMVLQFCDLGRQPNALIKSLSTGMRARLVLATALFSDWDFFLIDETVSVLDVEFRWRCEEYLRERVSEGAAVAVVSHDLGWIGRFCDVATYMERGRVRLQGSAPAVTSRFVDKLAILDGLREGRVSGESQHSFASIERPEEHRPTDPVENPTGV